MPFKPIKSLKDEELVVDLINRYRLLAASDDASIKQKLHALARIEYLAGLAGEDPGEGSAALPPLEETEVAEEASPVPEPVSSAILPAIVKGVEGSNFDEI